MQRHYKEDLTCMSFIAQMPTLLLIDWEVSFFFFLKCELKSSSSAFSTGSILQFCPVSELRFMLNQVSFYHCQMINKHAN